MSALNNTTFDTSVTYPVEKTIFCVLFAVTAMLGVAGNMFVISVIVCSYKMRKVTMNVILVNLAFADCMNIVTCLPDIFYSVAPYNHAGWSLGPEMCPLLRFCQVLSIYASVMLQTSVCMERFFAICYPIVSIKFRTKKRTAVGLLSAWFVAIMYASPTLFYNSVVLGYGKLYCKPAIHTFGNQYIHQTYKVVEFVVFYCAPAIITLTLYTSIAVSLQHSNSELLKTECSELHSNSEKVRRLQMIRQRQRVIVTLFICVLVYFVCYSPIQIGQLVKWFTGRNPAFVKDFMYTMFFNFLTYSSSAANPAIYVTCMPVFRRKLGLICNCHPISQADDDYTRSHSLSMANSTAISRAKVLRRPSPSSIVAIDIDIDPLAANLLGNGSRVSTPNNNMVISPE